MAHKEEMMIGGVLTEVTKFDQPAQNIDDAAAKSLWQSNPNLLDNAYFLDPVNQKGLTEYSGAVYGIDRWSGSNAVTTYSLTANGVSFKSNNLRFQQLFERPDFLVGKTLTLSALVTENAGTSAVHFAKLVSGTQTSLFTAPVGKTGLFFVAFTPEEGFEGIRVYTTSSYSGATTVAAMKLELGDTQTLAHQDNTGKWVLNEIPNYADGLRNCQRHQLVFSGDYAPIGIGQAATASAVEVYVPTPVSMRIKPAVTGSVLLRSGGAFVEATDTAVEAYSANSVRLIVTAAVTQGAVYECFCAAGAQVILDANL